MLVCRSGMLVCSGGSKVVGAVPPIEADAGDPDLAGSILGDALHRGAAHPAAGGRVAELRAGQRAEARRRLRIRAGGG